jgi:hypothetical protein
LLTPGAEELADATEAPYKFRDEKRTFHYRAAEEVKSRKGELSNASEIRFGAILRGDYLQAPREYKLP